MKACCLNRLEHHDVLIKRFSTVHFRLICVWCVLALILQIMMLRLTNIGVLHSLGGYFPLFDEYHINGTSIQVPSQDSINKWQTCLFQSDLVYTTVPNLDSLFTTFDIKITDFNKKLADHEIPLGPGRYEKFAGAMIELLIYVAELVTGMTLLGQAAVFIAWKRRGWLLSAACFGLYCSLVSITYYNTDPPLPMPIETNGTLLMLLLWLKKEYFDNVNNGNNHCDPAYYFVAFYLALCVLMTLIMGSGTTMAFTAELSRYLHSPPLPAPRGLRKLTYINQGLSEEEADKRCQAMTKKYVILNRIRDFATANTICMALLFCCCFIGRIVTSTNTLQCIKDYSAAPPVTPSLPTHAPTHSPTPAPHILFASEYHQSGAPVDYNYDMTDRIYTAMDGRRLLDDNPTFQPTPSPFVPTTDVIYYPDNYFPFKFFVPNMTTALWAVVFVTVVRGWMHGRLAPYRISFLAALGFIFLDLPSMLSNMEIFRLFQFHDFTTCTNTFKNPLFVYPNQQQAETYCNGMNFTSFSAICLISLMFIHLITCGIIWYFFYPDDFLLRNDITGGVAATEDDKQALTPVKEEVFNALPRDSDIEFGYIQRTISSQTQGSAAASPNSLLSGNSNNNNNEFSGNSSNFSDGTGGIARRLSSASTVRAGPANPLHATLLENASGNAAGEEQESKYNADF